MVRSDVSHSHEGFSERLCAAMRSAALVAVALIGLDGASSQEYTVEGISSALVPGPTFAYSINDMGDVVGSGADASGFEVGFVLRDGVISPLATFGGRRGIAWCINNDGVIGGAAELENRHMVGCLWTAVGMAPVPPLPGHTDSVVHSLNLAGTAVGYSYASSDRPRAIVFVNDTTLPLGTLGGQSSTANAINSSDVVAGWADGPEGRHACLFRLGPDGVVLERIDLGAFGTNYSVAMAINNGGTVAGYSYLPAGDTGAAIWAQGGVGALLGTLGGSASYANGINDSGRIVGSTYDSWGGQCAFIYDHASGMRNLNDLILSETGWRLRVASDINESGMIVGIGSHQGQVKAFVLRPFTTFEARIFLPRWLGNFDAVRVRVVVDQTPPLVLSLRDSGNHGRLSVPIPVTGTHRIWIKPSGFLSQVRTVSLTGFDSSISNQYNAVGGDTNNDDVIDDTDLESVLADYGGSQLDPERVTDTNGDGLVDDADITEVIVNFGLRGG